MKIQRYEHNEAQKRELFALIGEACASMPVRKRLGNTITSTPGDLWLVVTKGDDLLGFCALTKIKSRKAVKLHAFYSADTVLALTVEDKLRTQAEAEAIALGASKIEAVDFEARHRAYELQGWKIAAERGKAYRLYSKDLASV